MAEIFLKMAQLIPHFITVLQNKVNRPQKLSYAKNHDNPSKNIKENFKKAKRSVVSDGHTLIIGGKRLLGTYMHLMREWDQVLQNSTVMLLIFIKLQIYF